MNIAILGASGSVGSRVAVEALDRGHKVTAVSRSPEKITTQTDLSIVAGNIADPIGLANVLRDHDVVVSSVRFVDFQLDDLLTALEVAAVSRLAMVGGAGSLTTAAGTLLIDAPTFPDAVRPEAKAGQEKLEQLKSTANLDWIFVSPSALFMPGPRTGRYRLGTDQLLVDAEGKSWISQEDYAIALLDEIESPKFHRERFTVGY